MELYAKVRRAATVTGLRRREAAKRFGVSRNTFTKILNFSIPLGYRRRERPASMKLRNFIPDVRRLQHEPVAVRLRDVEDLLQHNGLTIGAR